MKLDSRKVSVSKLMVLIFLVVSGGVALNRSAIRAGAQEGFRVTAASLKADDARVTGTCPVKVIFNGYITVDGAGTVKYTFTRSDGATGPVHTLDFKKAGTQRVSTDWTLGDATALPSFSGWQAIKIISPNDLESSRETGTFSIRCAPPNSQFNPDDEPRSGGVSTGPPRALRASFRVALNGFRVERETRDDPLELDGVGDEVTLVWNAATINSAGEYSSIRGADAFSSIMGSSPPYEIRAGMRGDNGGLWTGDIFPTPRPWQRVRPFNPGVPPNILFEGELVQGENAALIIPTIWEWDNNRASHDAYADAIARDRPNIIRAVVSHIRRTAGAVPRTFVFPGASLGIGNTLTREGGNHPIGLRTRGEVSFTPQALVLTYDIAREAARADFRFGRGVIPVRYQDDGLEGDYTLFIQVEEIGATGP